MHANPFYLIAGKKVDLDRLDVNILASVTKGVFNELPEPIFTFALYEGLLGGSLILCGREVGLSKI